MATRGSSRAGDATRQAVLGQGHLGSECLVKKETGRVCSVKYCWFAPSLCCTPSSAVRAAALSHPNTAPDAPALGSGAWLGWPQEDFEMGFKQLERLTTVSIGAEVLEELRNKLDSKLSRNPGASEWDKTPAASRRNFAWGRMAKIRHWICNCVLVFSVNSFQNLGRAVCSIWNVSFNLFKLVFLGGLEII